MSKHYLKANDPKKCYECGNNCIECNEMSCTSCPYNFSRDPQNPMNCIPCGQNCLQCDFNSNNCTKCINKFYQVGSSCNQCGDNCDECDENKCLKCRIGLYGRDPKNQKNCIQCGTNCTQCKFEDSSCQICQVGYYAETSTSFNCSSCGTNCQNCDAINNCTQCLPKYYAELPDKFNCVECGSNCDQCNEIQCTQCNSDYPSLHQTNKMNCVKCDLNCKLCDLTNSTCTTCNDGYYQDPYDSTLCQKCGQNCQKCTSTSCIECNTNFPSLDPQNQMKCIICDDNCQSCNYNNNECNKCKDGYYVNSINKRACLKCGINCNKCSSSSECDICDPNFPSLDPLDKINCIKCDNNCQECDYTNNQCLKCFDGFLINPSNNRVCLKCGQFCDKCTDLSQCDTCNPDFPSLDPNNKMNCIKCDANCDICNYKNNECKNCKEGYFIYPSNQRICQQCGTNCKLCSSQSKCDVCHSDFPSLDPSNKMNCIKCDQNCKTCDNQTNECIECKDGFYINHNNTRQCLQCGQNCKKCDKSGCNECHPNFPRIDPNDKLSCVSCETNCLQCDISSTNCLKCKQGFPSLNPQNKANCIELGPNCLKSNFETAICEVCKDNSYFVDPANKLQCRTCGENCFECNKESDASCKKCNTLHYMKPGNNEDCFICGSNCKECNENGCIECITDNVYIDPKNPFNCKQCEDNCIKCTNYQCTQCKEENQIKYFQDPQDKKKCRTCHKSCQHCSDNLICLKCPSSMFLNPDNNEECLPCPQNCSECISISQCIKCINDSFYINNSNPNLCVPCEKGCKRCSQLKCEECDTETPFFDTQNIKQCRSCHHTCKECDTKTGECFCPQSTYKNNEECLPCPKGCFSCNMENKCIKCIQSNQFYSTEINECINCKENCLECSNTECTKCNSENLFQDPYKKTECRKCGTNCKVCDRNTAECLECIQSNYFISFNKQDCQQCNQENCQKCQLQGQSQECLVCSKGYYKDINSCKKCGENCLDCESSDNCKVCAEGFTKNENQKTDCIICSNNCLKCDSEKCIECKKMYTKDKENQQNCIQCDPSCSDCTSKKCLTCIDPQQSFIDQKQPQRCIKCDDFTKCLECNRESPQECNKCIDGYKINSKTKKCDFDCKASNCNQCYQFNPNQCDECKPNYFLNQQNRTCSEITESNKNSFTITDKLLNDGYEIKITFSKPLLLNNEDLQNQIQNFIELKIDNTSSLYQSEFISSLNNQLTYKIIPKSNVKNSKLSLKFKNQKFMSDNSVENEYQIIDLQPYVIVSQAQQEAAQNAQAVGEKVSQAASSSILPLSMVGNFYIITNTIDYTGFLYFLLFTKIRYPKNVLSFYSIFQDFQFPFIPNIFLNLIDSDYYQDTPVPFQMINPANGNNQQDAYFLKNAGQSITIMVGVFSVYIVLKIVSFIPIKYLQPYLKKSLNNTWEYSVFLDMLWTVYIYILIGSYLQFYSFDDSDRGSSAINYILFAIFNIQSFCLPFLLTYIMYKKCDVGSEKLFLRKFNTLFSGLNIQPLNKNNYTLSQQENTQTKLQEIKIKNQPEFNHNSIQSEINQRQNSESGSKEIFLNKHIDNQNRKKSEMRKQLSIKYSKYYYPILYFRKALFGLFIVYLCDYPILQLVLVSGLSIGVSFYLWFIQPFSSMIDNIKTIVWEYLMVAVYLTSGFLVEDKEDESEDHRFKIGWVIIGFTSILLGINTFLIIYNLLETILRPLFQFIQKNLCLKKQKNVLNEYKTTTSINILIPQAIQNQNISLIQNIHPEIKKSPKKDSTSQYQQKNPQLQRAQFQRKKNRIPSQISNVSGDNKDILSENFSFIMESDQMSQKQIRVFDYKPSNPSLIDGIKSHRPSNSEICFQQFEFHSQIQLGQKTPTSQKTQSSKLLKSPIHSNYILNLQKSQNLIQNENQ